MTCTNPMHAHNGFTPAQLEQMRIAQENMVALLAGMNYAQAFNVMSDVCGRLLATCYVQGKKQDAAWQEFGSMVAAYMHQFNPKAAAAREFRQMQPMADTVKN